MARRSRPRRTHLLGACATCRRRHVKCDQQRPTCKTCAVTGHSCEGFSNDVRWMSENGHSTPRDKSSTKRNHIKRNGMRRHLYSEQSRVSMGDALNKDLFSDSVDATIEEIDTRSYGTSASSFDDIRFGPFAVLNFNRNDQEMNCLSVEDTSKQATVSMSHGNSFTENILPTRGSHPSTDLPVTELTDDLLQWSDIFGLNDDLYGITSNFSLDLTSYPDFSTYPDWLTYDDGICNISPPPTLDLTPEAIHAPSGPAQREIAFPQQMTPFSPNTYGGILNEAPYLLRVFQKHVVPQLTIVPFGKKASWCIMNVPAAFTTLGELTILESEDVSHARQANLYSLLACAAAFLSMRPAPTPDDHDQQNHWQQYANGAYNEAKQHTSAFMKERLGALKAKYKDRTMAICGMIEAANFNGKPQDARRFTLEAETLLRRRGIYKPKVSHKSRLLVNVYTWLRIVGESTYVLQDFRASKEFIDALTHQIKECRPGGLGSSPQPTNDRNLQLDDFLSMEHSDNDLDIDSPKDSRKDIPDIHLQDSRKSAATLAKQVYGISETWLSLVSQTTRLANVMEKVRAAQASDIQLDSKVSHFLQERSDRLESVIHSYVSQHESLKSSAYPEAYANVFRAFNAGLVIFFYRRVRRVHPGILQDQVNTVIHSLQALHNELVVVDHTGPGIMWPIFMAGCESITSAQRTAILDLVEKSEQKCQLPPFQEARCIMNALWERNYGYHIGARRNSLYSWMDVAKERKAWPIFC